MKKTAAPFGIPIPEAAQVFYRTAGRTAYFLIHQPILVYRS